MDAVWDVAIVGAGVAGLSAARELRHAGRSVLVLDKGSRVGGRVSTRAVGGARFDTGAQFFTALAPEFVAAVEAAHHDGAVAHWYDRAPRRDGHRNLAVWRGADGNAALPRWLADSLVDADEVAIHTGVRVTSVAQDGGRYRLTADAPDLPDVHARSVLLTPPVPQALEVLAPAFESTVTVELAEFTYHPCLALLVGLSEFPVGVFNEHGFRRPDSPAIEWIADNVTKGVSTAAEDVAAALTVHSSAAFAVEHLSHDDSSAIDAMSDALRSVMSDAGIRDARDAGRVQLKRWRYARPVELCSDRYAEVAPRLLMAGDTFAGPRVEGAFLSGLNAARRLIAEAVS